MMRKKLLASILTVCMLLSLLPVTALAAEGSPGTWAEAVTVAPEGYTADAGSKTVSISSAEGLAWFAKLINNAEEDKDSANFAGYTITIDGTIDLAGHEWVSIDTATAKSASNNKIESYNNRLLEGAKIVGINNATIKNMYVYNPLRGPKDGSQPGDGQNAWYYYGFIGRQNGDLTIEDLTFENAVVDAWKGAANDDHGGSSMAVVSGYYAGGTLTLKNVTLSNCSVDGMQKIGGYVGQCNGSVTIEKCAVVGSTFRALYQCAPVIAYAMNNQYNNDSSKRTNNLAINGVKLENNRVVIVKDENTTYKTFGDNVDAWYYTTQDGYSCWCGNQADAVLIAQSLFSPVGETKDAVADKPLTLAAQVGGYQYDTLAHAIAAVNAMAGTDAVTIQLLSDVTETLHDTSSGGNNGTGADSSLWITRDNVTVDLNNKTLTTVSNHGGSYNVLNFFADGGTLKNGSIIAKHSDGSFDSYAFGGEKENGTLTVNNVKATGGIALYDTITATIGGNDTMFAMATNFYAVYTEGGAKAIITGGAYTAKASNVAILYANSGSSIEVSGGYFNGDTIANHVESLRITGGYFTSDPSAYCGEALTGVDSGRADYPYTVGQKGAEVVPVAPAAPDVKEPEVQYAEDSAEKTLLNAAQTALTATAPAAEGTGLEAAAKTQANSNTTVVTDEIVAALNNAVADDVTETNTHIVVQHYTEIIITKVDAGTESGQKSITLEIQPMYRTVATTVDVTAPNADDVVVQGEAESGETVNAVMVGEPKELTVTGPVEITIPLPTGFVTDNGSNLVVRHKKGDVLVGYHETTYDSEKNTVTFINDKGFSAFAVLADDRSASVQFKNKDGNSIGSAETYGPADVNKDLPRTEAPSGQIFNGWTFEGLSGTYTALTDPLLTALSGKGTVTATPSFYTPSSGGTATYAITVEQAEHGAVTVSPMSAAQGSTVTITTTPDTGYKLDALTATDAQGNKLELSAQGSFKYSFTMPASQVRVTATFIPVDEPAFTDVPAGAYYADAVAWAVKAGLVNGTSATTFSPDADCTRAQMVTLFWRASGSPAPKGGSNPFADVQPGSYFYDAVLWAAENGIVNGTSATTFSPNAGCTRAQMVTLFWRAAGSPAASGSAFADVPADAYYAGAVAWAAAEGIVNGTSATTFSPDANCTRGQVVTFLYRSMA